MAPPAFGPASSSGGGTLAAAIGHLQSSREWSAQASQRAGVPPPLQLLPSLPLGANPAWRRSPSFAAAAALLVPPAASPAASDKQQAADLVAVEAVLAGTGLGSRAVWATGDCGAFFCAAMPYTHCDGVAHRQAQLLPLTLAGLAPRDGGPAAAGGSGTDAAAQRRAEAIFREVAADQRPIGLRLLGYLLSHLFRWLFGREVYVDAGALARLRALYEQGGAGAGAPRAALVYVPAHKSHVDYLMLSYVLFGCGLPCPHIAAGANLRLPGVAALLRGCGAFFIRRTARGSPDQQQYKGVLAAYVRALLQAGQSLEFFIEGGRSRDGRVNPPKLGMLRMALDAVAGGGVHRPVYLVPTAMNYDALLEEGSLAAQLAGAAKKSESLTGLACTCWGIFAKALRVRWQRWALGLGAGGYCGRATVAFGEPISVQQWLQEHQQQLAGGGAAERGVVAALGERVTTGIRQASVLPTSALLVASLFAEQHLGSSRQPRNGRAGISGASLAQTAASMEWLADELQQQGAAVVRLPRDAAGDDGKQRAVLRHLASMLPQCCTINSVAAPSSSSSGSSEEEPLLCLQRGTTAALLQHSRLNQLLPWLAPQGLLLVGLLLAAGSEPQGATRAAVLESAAWLRSVLGPEMDTALGPGVLASPADFEPALQGLLASDALQQHRQRPGKGAAGSGQLLQLSDHDSGARRAALLAAALLAPLLASYLEALRGMTAALAAAGSPGCTVKALCSAAQKRLLALTTAAEAGSSSSSSMVVPSVALVQNAARSFAAAGLLVPVQAHLPNGSAAAEPAMVTRPAAAQAAAEAEALQLSHASSSGEESSGGEAAVDEEYGVDPAAPAASPAAAALPPPSGESASPQPGRRSFERRRARQQKLLEAAQQRSSAGASSRSGSDSEMDPIAESVAANLCRLDISPPPACAKALGPAAAAPLAAAPRHAAAGQQAAGTAAAATMQHHHEGPVVLARDTAMPQLLEARLEAALAAVAACLG